MKRILVALIFSLFLTACSSENHPNQPGGGDDLITQRASEERFSFTIEDSQAEVNPELEVVFLSISLKPNDPTVQFTSPWNHPVPVEDGLVDIRSDVACVWLFASSQESLNLKVGDQIGIRLVDNNGAELISYSVQILKVQKIQ